MTNTLLFLKTRLPAEVGILLMCLLYSTKQTHAQFYYNEPCTQQTGIFTYYGDAPGYTVACCGDQAGQGWLRLTQDQTGKQGWVRFQKTFPSSLGVSIEFDFTVWGVPCQYGVADGFCVFLHNPAVTFGIGGVGGSLSYEGMAGAYLGVIIDEYGSFTGPNGVADRGGSAVPGVDRHDAISIANANYQYVAGTLIDCGQGISLNWENSTSTRPTDAQFYRRIKIDIEPNGTNVMKVTVYLKTTQGAAWGSPLLGPVNIAGTVPPTFGMGFAGNTGGGCAKHEVRNVIARTPGEVSVTMSSVSCPNIDNITIQNKVYNGIGADTLAMHDTLPAHFVLNTAPPAKPVSDPTAANATIKNFTQTRLPDNRLLCNYRLDFVSAGIATVTYNGYISTQPATNNFTASTEVVVQPGWDLNLSDNKHTITVPVTMCDTVTYALCPEEEYVWFSQTITAAGTYTHKLKTKNGNCDSTIVLIATMLSSNPLPDTVLICEGESHYFTPKYPALTLSGTYRDTLSSVKGCDSVVVLYLEVKPVYTIPIKDTICKGDLYFFHKGYPYLTTDTLMPSSAGDTTIRCTLLTTREPHCDSTVVLTLTVLDLHSEIVMDICEGEGGSYVFGKDTLVLPAGTYIYRDSLTGTRGCDSIVTLTLNVWKGDSLHFDDRSCPGENYVKHGFNIPHRNIDTAGTYDFTRTLKTIHGCDSILTLTLTVPELSVEITSSNPDFCDTRATTLSARFVPAGASLFWSTGEHSTSIAVQQSGTYTVTVSEGGCAVSDKFIINACPSAIVFPNAITPGNHDNINDYFYLVNTEDVKQLTISIHDRWGQLVFYSKDKNFQWDGRVYGKIIQSVYNYVVLIITNDGSELRKTGSITVL
ncbi:MAG: gliding motility-associated C-terminal domain-containing protein [Bacteroidales bacterium]|nr:gliding motility-associated C-terminal domain-containing protein [Bacteroidales bacterium]